MRVFMHGLRLARIAAIGVTIPAVAAAQQASTCSANPTGINYAMFIGSKPQDAAGCAMEVRDGQIRIVPTVTNAAMTCPDMFGWRLFAEAVRQEFWKGWATDPDTWPSNPLPMCGPAGPAGACCSPDAASNPGYDDPNTPAKNCPFFPGAHVSPERAVMLRVGQPPSKAHVTFAGVPEVPLRMDASVDPGRQIRQSMAELVFRNRPMFDFVFKNNLYNQQGLQALFRRNADYLRARSTPYRQKNRPDAMVDIDFPVDAIMIKSNWLNEKRAQDMGLRDDPANPYVKMTITTAVNDNNAPIFEAGVHWLVAFHISSKDTPNWVWATFEHVNNPGRCDYIGCNDSYGYATPDTVSADQANNFTTPHTKCDNLPLGGWVFDLGKTYPGGARSDALAGIFRGLGIGTGGPSIPPPPNAPTIPSARDPGWNSYRLKGSQTQFTDSMGNPTRLGNSVTEGGFVNTSSCITCHGRASINAKGTVMPPLGVFVTQTSETGYLQSANGTPVPDWYRLSIQPTQPPAPPVQALNVVQSDFVWGFLAANCIANQPTEGCPAAAPAAAAASSPALRASPAAAQRTPVPSVRERVMELR